MSIIDIVIVCEVILFNSVTLDRCCRRKYNFFLTLGIIVAFTALLIAGAYFSIRSLPFYGNGNGLFTILGFLYLIPLHFLYKEKTSLHFLIICISWIYTLGVFALAVQIGKLIGEDDLSLYTLIAETSLFLLSMYPFYKYIVPKYVYILENMHDFGKRWNILLFSNGCLQFLTMIGINFVFASEPGSGVKVFVIALLIATAFFSYIILHRMVRESIRKKELEHKALHDPLTGIYNRLKLLSDLNQLISTNQTFSLLFLDLDHFKEINDSYGHVTGDDYLKHFSQICVSALAENGNVYRFGGDEFLIIYYGTLPQAFVERIRECREWKEGAPCPFNRVSVGTLSCTPPHDTAEEILQKVDRLMYQNKKEKQLKPTI